MERSLEWLLREGALSQCVAALGGGVRIEDSVLAPGRHEFGVATDWQTTIRESFSRLVHGKDGTARCDGDPDAILTSLCELSSNPTPSLADVQLVADLARWFVPTRLHGPTHPGPVEWRERNGSRYDLRVRGVTRPLARWDLARILRDEAWADAVPPRKAVMFDRASTATDNSAIPVYTIGEIKGLEFDAALVVMQGGAPEPLGELFVGVSRARLLVTCALDDLACSLLPIGLRTRLVSR